MLYRGGPRHATPVLVTYAYSTGFDSRRQGYAAAIGVVVYVAVLIFTARGWRVQKTREVEGQ